MTHRRHHHRRRFRRDSYLIRSRPEDVAGPRNDARPLPFEIVDAEGWAEPAPPAAAPVEPAAVAAPPSNGKPPNGKLSTNGHGTDMALAAFPPEDEVRRQLLAEPASADAHLALGVLLSRKGLWREAIAPLRRAVELDPGRAPAWDHLGEALNHVDDLDGALQAFHRSTELRPNGARALRGLGIVYDRLNRPAEAAQMYRRSRELAGT